MCNKLKNDNKIQIKKHIQWTLDNSKSKQLQEKFELSRLRIIKKLALSRRKKNKLTRSDEAIHLTLSHTSG